MRHSRGRLRLGAGRQESQTQKCRGQPAQAPIERMTGIAHRSVLLSKLLANPLFAASRDLVNDLYSRLKRRESSN